MKLKQISIFLIFLIFVSCSTKDSNDKVEKELKENKGIKVDVACVKKGNLIDYIETTATAEAIQKGSIESRVQAKITAIKVFEGDPVEKGDTLFIVDNTLIKNEWMMTSSKFLKALSDLLLELETMTESQTIQIWSSYMDRLSSFHYPVAPLPEVSDPRVSVILARLDILVLYQQIKAFEYQMDQCFITAPFSGVISDLDVYPGASVKAGQELCSLTDLSEILIYADILEDDLYKIRHGSRLIVLFNGTDTTEISGILPKINQDRHSGIVQARISNTDQHLKDMQRVRVKIERNVYRNLLFVPRSAILTRNDRNLVFKVENSIAKWQYVETGFGTENTIEILSGLNEGDSIISGGHYSLGHNVKVQVSKN